VAEVHSLGAAARAGAANVSASAKDPATTDKVKVFTFLTIIMILTIQNIAF
jgi:hypothetical protein